MDRLADQRVAVVGTGATAVQCVPELAKTCQELYVFQRTPSSVDVRGNHDLDPEWFARMATPGWQRRWLDNFTANWEGIWGAALDRDLDDLVQDGWTDLARRMRSVFQSIPPDQMTIERMMEVFEDADDVKMDEIRARVDALVADPGTAADLKAWYRQLCKRPCFHDEYLQAFNRPNTHLVDTDGRGVERITPSGVVANGVEYPVDCVIYASGFEFGGDFTDRAGFDPEGVGGIRLSQAWAEGTRTLHGLHVDGFPNLFIVQLAQGAFLVSNVPHNYVDASQTVAAVVGHALAGGHDRVEATGEAVDKWVDFVVTNGMLIARDDCTPGYYNNEGQPLGPKERANVGYPGGAMAFFGMMDEWRRNGRFEGLTFG
jgi:cyclohexanone monooxygenase